MTGVALPLVPLALSKTTTEMPTPLPLSVAVKLLTWSQLTPESVLFHRPALRDPKERMLGRLASPTRRSPFERPSSLPPILNGTSVFCQVLPRSFERIMEPFPAHDWVYMPAAM